ncbi:unnamed protein product [Gordionus sp. m RMFG-2023]
MIHDSGTPQVGSTALPSIDNIFTGIINVGTASFTEADFANFPSLNIATISAGPLKSSRVRSPDGDSDSLTIFASAIMKEDSSGIPKTIGSPKSIHRLLTSPWWQV